MLDQTTPGSRRPHATACPHEGDSGGSGAGDETIDERQAQIVARFEHLEDGMARYMHLIRLARSAPAMHAAHKTAENRVGGCQAEAWMRSFVSGGRLHFEADSPSLIVKGVAVLLTRVLSGQPPGWIADADLWFIHRIGLQDQLSPTRSNGLSAMVQRMQAIARTCFLEDPLEAEGRS